MYQYHCLNTIAEVGLKNFDGNYAKTDKIEDADAVLVRSAVMHDMESAGEALRDRKSRSRSK